MVYESIKPLPTQQFSNSHCFLVSFLYPMRTPYKVVSISFRLPKRYRGLGQVKDHQSDRKSISQRYTMF